MIKVYTAPNCPYCEALKRFLKENGILFEELDVSKDPKVVTELISKSNQAGVPVIDINGKIIVGFNREAIIKALLIKEKH
jgi:glutaredoxin-like YruB-family protein